MKYEFKDNVIISSSDIFYDVFDGGGIVPEELLKNSEQAKQVRQAINVVEDFLSDAIGSGALEVV